MHQGRKRRRKPNKKLKSIFKTTDINKLRLFQFQQDSTFNNYFVKKNYLFKKILFLFIFFNFLFLTHGKDFSIIF